ncbi:putative tyrosine-tRNA ligase [Hyaloraphidium curvatum]|nr:putative tyrosine-tRNA ligase [Hyaloraphidium curvatum]
MPPSGPAAPGRALLRWLSHSAASARGVRGTRAPCSARNAATAVPGPVSGTDVVAALEERGLVHACTSHGLRAAAKSRRLTVYAGFDPTARSLHVGNLLTIIGLLHFQLAGHNVIALLGGATATIGDPTGRTTERPVLTQSELALNTASIDWQLHNVFQSAWSHARRRSSAPPPDPGSDPSGGEPSQQFTVVNNLDWYGGMSLLSFLKDVGRHARVPQMLTRDSVKSRLQPDAPDEAAGAQAHYEGLSFTEFSYQLLQAFDFYYLSMSHGCNVQLGGSDQWGNITAGTDLIRRKSQDAAEAFGLTLPLVVTDKGEKFGKSAGNAIWLDEEMCPVFDFYQFFRRTPDSMCPTYLRYFTFLSPAEIDQVARDHADNPSRHVMQRTLAGEVTRLVHGEAKAVRAETQASVLYDEDVGGSVPLDRILAAFRGDQRLVTVKRDACVGSEVWKLAVDVQLFPSKSQALKHIKSGGLYLNKVAVESDQRTIAASDLIHGAIFTLRAGKSNYKIVHVD